MITVRRFFTDHVSMCLKDHRLRVFITFRRRDPDDNVSADRIHFRFKSLFSSALRQICGDPFLPAGGPGNLSDIFKNRQGKLLFTVLK